MRLQVTVKRSLDVVVAMLVLIVLAPLLLVIAIVHLLLEKWPLFYNSRRYVSADKVITVYKFRTMVKDAKSEKYQLAQRFMRGGYLDIPLSCEVFTPIGRFLERTQLVEIPQLLNVVAGQMSLVGNRPLPRENVERLKAYDHWRERFDSPAGISGISQVVGKLSLEPEERLALESAYSEVYQNGNVLKCDLMIFVQTIRVIVFAEAMTLEKAHKLLQSSLPHAPEMSQGIQRASD